MTLEQLLAVLDEMAETPFYREMHEPLLPRYQKDGAWQTDERTHEPKIFQQKIELPLDLLNAVSKFRIAAAMRPAVFDCVISVCYDTGILQNSAPPSPAQTESCVQGRPCLETGVALPPFSNHPPPQGRARTKNPQTPSPAKISPVSDRTG